MIRTVKDYEKLSEQYNKMLEERNSIIDDLPWYKAKVSRLEDENEQLKQDLLRTEELQDEIIQLEKDFENKQNLLSEFSQHIGNKPSSSKYKYFRAKLNALEIREGD